MTFRWTTSALATVARLPRLSAARRRDTKIDPVFVAKLPGMANDQIIVDTIITMGRSLGLRIVAEGVETEAQHCFPEAHGCQRLPGLPFQPPSAVGRTHVLPRAGTESRPAARQCSFSDARAVTSHGERCCACAWALAYTAGMQTMARNLKPRTWLACGP